ncbi:TPA: hypothetical protein ACXHW4_004661 [Enterobacter hormaechei]
MNISASTSRGYFGSREIKESGFLNFERQGDGIQLTVYLHKGSNGTLILAHNNSLSLDKELSRRMANLSAGEGLMYIRLRQVMTLA